jgi:hypothetical protein
MAGGSAGDDRLTEPRETGCRFYLSGEWPAGLVAAAPCLPAPGFPYEILTRSLCLFYGFAANLNQVTNMMEARLAEGAAPVCAPLLTEGARIEVVVVYTSMKRTLAALRAAGSLARGFDARIHLVVPQIVPFPAQLDEPPVQKEFAERKFRTLAEESAIETRVDICLCRDRETGVLHSIRPRSIVVVGAAMRFWPFGRERRLARTLRKHGHQVLLVSSN